MERTLLNHYNLTSLYPTEWPPDKDEGDVSDDGRPSAALAKSKPKRRFTTIEQRKTSGSSIDGSREAQGGEKSFVQKDEPDPLGKSQSVVGILRHRGLPVEDNLKLRNQFLLSSTTFSPSQFLSEVHNTASTDDLLRGLDYLSRSIDQKSASLKVLVESNFERFVRAKATIDNVYKEMRNHGKESEMDRQSQTRQFNRNQTTHGRKTSGPMSPTSLKNVAHDKRRNALIKESEYGILGVKAPLLDATARAEEIWGPAFGGREREESLKAVLQSLEKNRAIFEVGAAIESHIKSRDYEALTEEYARAQRYAQEAKSIADRAKHNELRLSDAQIHQIVITARVWMDIQNRINEFKRDLWKKLENTHFRTGPGSQDNKSEEYMELIAVLLQIGVEENPITQWLISRHEYLRNKVHTAFERARIELEIMRRHLSKGQKSSAKSLASHLRAAANARSQDDHKDIDIRNVIRFWEKLKFSLSSLLSTQNGVVGEMVEFWDIIQSFIEGKKQKSLPIGVDGQSRKHHTLPNEGVRDLQQRVVELFSIVRDQLSGLFMDAPVEDISSLFTPLPPLTPNTPQSTAALTPGSRTRFNFKPEDLPPSSPKVGEHWEKLAFWPPYSNCVSAAIFLSKIVTLIASTMVEIASVRLVKQNSELITGLRNLVGDVRERTITSICAAWLADSENCRELEDWTRSQDKPNITNLPAYFQSFETNMLTNLQKIVFLSQVSSTSSEVITPPPSRYTETVQRGFKNSLYKSFSGMMGHAANPASKGGEKNGGEEERLIIPLVNGSTNVSKGEVIDVSNSNVRKLLTLSNFQALRSDTVPQLISAFESNFLLTASEDRKVAQDVLSQMSSRVFTAYVSPTVDHLKSLISTGVSSPTYGAPTIPSSTRPTDARPYVYAVLLHLVLVHTEVSRTAPNMTAQILTFLHESISEAHLGAFSQARTSYTLPQLMQATLDVEFIAQTLSAFTSDKASDAQGKIYLALDERTDNDARLKLQGELPEMRTILKRLRDGTRGEFACFKKDKKKASREKDKDRGERSEREKETG